MYSYDPPAGPFLPKFLIIHGPDGSFLLIRMSFIAFTALVSLVQAPDLGGSRYADPLPVTSSLTLTDTHHARLSAQGNERHP
jgi:hypothetical protein